MGGIVYSSREIGSVSPDRTRKNSFHAFILRGQSLLMQYARRSPQEKRVQVQKWASSARDWDLARELDSCKHSRDSFQRQIGLLAIDSHRGDYESLISRNSVNQERIEIIEMEISKRKFGSY
jgi:hypothetical protein